MYNKKGSGSILWMVVIGLFIGIFVSVISENIQLKRHYKVIAKSKFDEVMYHINNVYVDTVKVADLEEEAIVAMMDELDPHSQYISLEEFNTVNDPLLGSFEGIGVQFRIVEDTVTIVNTIKGGTHIDVMSGFVTVKEGTTIQEYLRNIYIENTTTGKTVRLAGQGEYPYAIIVPQEFCYAEECTPIIEAYENFLSWAQNAKSSKDWYNHGKADKYFPSLFKKW